MLNTTRLIKINNKKMMTNLRSNQLYSKEQLVNDLRALADEIENRPEGIFFAKFKLTPYLHIELTSYKEVEKHKDSDYPEN